MRKLKIFFINLILFLVLGELALLLYLTLKNNRLITASELYDSAPAYLDGGECKWGDTVTLHPYFGYSYKSTDECQYGENNHGLNGADFPIERDERFHTILLTGGSVAEQLSAGHMGGPGELEKKLQQWRASGNKPIRVLTGAIAGGLQPATIMHTALFLNVVDEVVSVESYNEGAAMPGETGRIENTPYVWLELSARARHPLQFLALTKLSDFRNLVKNSVLRHSLLLNAFFQLSFDPLLRDFESKIHAGDPFPLFPEDWDLLRRRQFYVSRYVSHLRKIAAMVRSQNKSYTLFLQPVPYKYKVLTEDEKKVTATNMYDPANIELIQSTAKAARDLGALSLERVFENTPQALYIDHIHTNGEGTGILAEAIANSLAIRQGWIRKPVSE